MRYFNQTDKLTTKSLFPFQIYLIFEKNKSFDFRKIFFKKRIKPLVILGRVPNEEIYFITKWINYYLDLTSDYYVLL